MLGFIGWMIVAGGVIVLSVLALDDLFRSRKQLLEQARQRGVMVRVQAQQRREIAAAVHCSNELNLAAFRAAQAMVRESIRASAQAGLNGAEQPRCK